MSPTNRRTRERRAQITSFGAPPNQRGAINPAMPTQLPDHRRGVHGKTAVPVAW